MKKSLAIELTKYIKEKHSIDECSGFTEGFKKAWEVLEQMKMKEVDDNANDGVISICLVPHGYQLDILDWQSYLHDKVKTLGSECRDYGDDVDTEAFGQKIIDMVRKGED
jgi:hypothetical protein